ncbi:MAG TPA: hypothetical protein GYA07_12810 [Verrucomicrobia bacterium]|nr:hypothetical protein [Verrucomicrobiota bacterium]HOB31650.1 DUF6174 domain-containing protein [Verrucomicrobiota bacterium]
MAPHRRGIVFVALAMMSYAGAVAFGQAPELILHPAASQIPDRVVMSIRPHSTNWVLLEASSDLKDWQPVVNFMTTLTSGPFIDVPPSPSPVRFYRARAPGVSAATALSAWQAVRPAHYQYRFHFVKGQTSINVWEGTVTISNGVKTVSNVIVNENPTTTFNPADFLTPEEVFGFIATVEAQGARLAHVAYDPQWHFPSSVLTLLDQAPSFADYRMAGFVELSGAAVSTNGEPGAPANGSLPGGPRAFRSQWSRTIAALNTGARGK